MSVPRRERAKVYAYVRVEQPFLNISGQGLSECFLCGKRHRSMVTTVFRHEYDGTTVSEAVCMYCVGRSIPVKDYDMQMLRALLQHQENLLLCGELFSMIDALQGRYVHYVFSEVLDRHEKFQPIHKDTLSDALYLANVYTSDPDLWESYKWLRENKHLAETDNVVCSALISFSGLGRSWPNYAQRDVIRALREKKSNGA